MTTTEVARTTKSERASKSPQSHLPLEYPSDLECDVASDGLRYMIRPIVPDDAEALKVFHTHLSPYSRYLRFFNYHPALSPDEIRHFTCVDYSRRLALVAVVDDRIIGVGRFDRQPATDEAEVAFAVADDFHHHGVATLLLDQLVGAARCRGITSFVAHTLWENHDMLSVFLHSGFDVIRDIDGGVVTLRFPIRYSPGSRWALVLRDATRQVTPHANVGRG
jgi:GNAT superfamily N-acetyltransferase